MYSTKAKNLPNSTCINGVYYFVYYIPKSLHKALNKKLIKFSLKTSDFSFAKFIILAYKDVFSIKYKDLEEMKNEDHNLEYIKLKHDIVVDAAKHHIVDVYKRHKFLIDTYSKGFNWKYNNFKEAAEECDFDLSNIEKYNLKSPHDPHIIWQDYVIRHEGREVVKQELQKIIALRNSKELENYVLSCVEKTPHFQENPEAFNNILPYSQLFTKPCQEHYRSLINLYEDCSTLMPDYRNMLETIDALQGVIFKNIINVDKNNRERSEASDIINQGSGFAGVTALDFLKELLNNTDNYPDYNSSSSKDEIKRRKNFILVFIIITKNKEMHGYAKPDLDKWCENIVSVSKNFTKKSTFLDFNKSLIYNKEELENALTNANNNLKRTTIVRLRGSKENKEIDVYDYYSKTTIEEMQIAITKFFTSFAKQEKFNKPSNEFAKNIHKNKFKYNFSRHNNSPNNNRELWLDKDIKALVNTPIWQGRDCFKPKARGKYKIGEKVILDAFYFIPLIAMYTGARNNEICQLKRHDIEEIEISTKKSYMFNFTNEDSEGLIDKDKSIKNTASKRKVLVHLDIIKLRFLEYIEQFGQNDRIFPQIKKLKNKRYSDEFSKFFTDYRKANSLYIENIDFHSFRHTVVTMISNNDAFRQEDAAKVVGHTQEDTNNSITKKYNHVTNEKIYRVISEGINYKEYGLDVDALAKKANSKKAILYNHIKHARYFK